VDVNFSKSFCQCLRLWRRLYVCACVRVFAFVLLLVLILSSISLSILVPICAFTRCNVFVPMSVSMSVCLCLCLYCRVYLSCPRGTRISKWSGCFCTRALFLVLFLELFCTESRQFSPRLFCQRVQTIIEGVDKRESRLRRELINCRALLPKSSD